jgi:hypothetical protein
VRTDKNVGTCHICGKVGKLSYEHVPPAKAFNSYPGFMHFGDELLRRGEAFPWEFTTKGKQMQRGVGFYTLCEKCNPDTGGWYGGSFVDFIYKGYKFIMGMGGTNSLLPQTKRIINLEDIYPLRIIKQIITMFFSVNSPVFAKAKPELVKFVKNKTTKGLSREKYGIYIYILRGSLARYAGSVGILAFNQSRIVSEISCPPFGYVFEMNPKEEFRSRECEITDFGNLYDFNEKANISLTIPVYESNTPFPLDYRNKQQIFEDYMKNLLYEMESGGQL